MYFVWISEQTAIFSLYNINWLVFWRVRKTAKSDYYFPHVCLSVCLSVRPHGTSRPPLCRFSWNLIFEHFSNICRKKILSLISDKNNGYFTRWGVYIYVPVSPISLRKRKVLDEIYRENQNTHFMFSNFFLKSCRLWDNVEKYGRAGIPTETRCVFSIS